MSSFFIHIHNTLKAHKWLSTSVFLVLVCVCIYLVSRLHFNEDISALLPKDAQSEKLQEVIKTAKFNDKVIVLFSSETPDAETLSETTKAFSKTLLAEENPYIKNSQGTIDATVIFEAQDLIFENLPLFLNETDYDSLAKAIQPKNISNRLQQLKKNLRSPLGILTARGYRKDPFQLRLNGLKAFQDLQLDNGLQLNNGVLMTEDQKTSVLFLDLKVSSQDGEQSGAVVEFINQQIENSSEDFPNIKISAIGGVFYNVSNAAQIKNDIKVTLSIAGTALLLILILFFRSLKVPILLFLPTLLSALIALAILAVWKQQVSAIALGVGSIILGITLDYALHTLTHLRNSESIEKVYKSITKPILLSSCTTAIAFLCLVFVGSEALLALGVFSAISVLMASIFALVLIPLLYSPKRDQSTRRTIIDRLADFNYHSSKIVTLIVLVLCVSGTFLLKDVQFEKDLNGINFQTEDLKSAESLLDETIQYKDNTTVYLVSYAGTLNETLLKNTEVLQTLKNLEDTLALSFSSIGNIALPNAIQTKKIEQWQRFWTASKRQKHQEQLDSTAISEGFNATTFQPWHNRLSESFQPINFDDFKGVANFSINNFISKGDKFTTITTPLSVRNTDLKFLSDQFSEDDNVFVVNRQALNESLLSKLKDTFNRLIWFSMLAVFLVMIVFFRSVWLSLLTLLPIILSWLLTLGVMAVFGLQFNVFNIIICSFIFGLCVDFSIFITNGIVIEAQSKTIVLKTYKTSILLSVITTLLGMGALIFAKHPALHSVAAVSIIGVISALVVCFTVHPFVLQWYVNFRKKKE